jgi:hypothetical protein
MNYIKVVPENWGGYFSEILDEDVQEGSDECEGVEGVKVSGNGTQESERAMLKMTTCCWRIREGYEKDGVNIFWTKSLRDGIAVSVDMKKRICGWKRAKGGLHNWP